MVPALEDQGLSIGRVVVQSGLVSKPPTLALCRGRFSRPTAEAHAGQSLGEDNVMLRQ